MFHIPEHYSITPSTSRSYLSKSLPKVVKCDPQSALSDCTMCVAKDAKNLSNSQFQSGVHDISYDKQSDAFYTNSDDSLSSDNASSGNNSSYFCKSHKDLIKNKLTENSKDAAKVPENCRTTEKVILEPIPSTSSYGSQPQCSSLLGNSEVAINKNTILSNQTDATAMSESPTLPLRNSHICSFSTIDENNPTSNLISSNLSNESKKEEILEDACAVSFFCKQTNDFNDDTWGDCDETSDEEVCTCCSYSTQTNNDLEDELPSKDVDLSKYMQSVTMTEDLLTKNSTTTIGNLQRKRKLKDIQGNEPKTGQAFSPPIGRKRIALESTSSSGDPRRFASRTLIPTKDNPPPELENWIKQFQRWSHVERLVAVDKLIAHCEPTQVRHMMKVIEPQFQRDFISLLPKELALQVLSYLDPKDLLRAAQTCRSWRFLCDDNLLWKEKCKQSQIMAGPNSDQPKRGRAGNMPAISSPWKAAFIRQHIIETNWRSKPIREPKILKGHDDHVITCLQFHGNRIVSGSDDNTLKVWSAINGKCLRTLVGHTGGVWSSQMSGNIIISGSTDRTLKVWNMDTGHCIHTLQGHTSTVRCMHLHGKKVVSGSRDATLRVWDIEKGLCLHVLVGHLAAVRCVQYDGKLIVSGAYDYMVKVWNPERQECLHTLQGHTNRVYSLQFDGIHIVSGSLDTSIRVWDAETGSCKHTLMGHQSLTSGMELRQNILVSGNADSTVKVWDITTGQCLQTLSGSNKHQSAVTCLQFNSSFVITSSDDGTVKLWDVKTGEFIRNLVSLDSGGSGGVVWRIRASDTKLICAVGSRNGTEETKLMVLDFDVDGACAKCS
ncbi:F-box/WD repeat-containing protein 7 isoform X2 [Hermetia illucens]|uniref:F-box/WD repeat-containing protein 7 isoform X2 n=1 Tax=Hermetia illucens TaxID=343691 RepID=UPI0018CBF1CA|nr:F-box/WD repeat-containing protein 7 isoform X2 [Hermetia illucens]XP_037904410.1 F-box/WD repeat-containing protein 7 isoform X2 [Hermetia illucens]XP_037904411.1 F-box/WD repeat-containing protein 7 isoform X2 [Hermetia illucens]XP_037904412.1 F-box/WD repeat-containing protein 7 isoform X2 [Hermetia illucens]